MPGPSDRDVAGTDPGERDAAERGSTESGSTEGDRAASRPHPGGQLAALLGWLLVASAAGAVGSVLQGADVGTRYLALARPAWAPPPWAFGVVWPVLYVLIGVAAWRVWRAAGGLGAATAPLALWGGQLLLNALWPWVFFGLEAFWPAVAVILALDLAVLATLVAFARRDRLAAWLLSPYLAWIVYATALNVAIAANN